MWIYVVPYWAHTRPYEANLDLTILTSPSLCFDSLILWPHRYLLDFFWPPHLEGAPRTLEDSMIFCWQQKATGQTWLRPKYLHIFFESNSEVTTVRTVRVAQQGSTGLISEILRSILCAFLAGWNWFPVGLRNESFETCMISVFYGIPHFTSYVIYIWTLCSILNPSVCFTHIIYTILHHTIQPQAPNGTFCCTFNADPLRLAGSVCWSIYLGSGRCIAQSWDFWWPVDRIGW